MPSQEHAVLFAQIELPTKPPSFFERSIWDRIRQILSPELKVERYGRTWRFSKPDVWHNRFVVAKLGFSKPDRQEQIRFDEDLKDYVEEVADEEDVNFCHFAIDLERLLMAFELRKPDIRRRSFTGNFEALTAEGGEKLELQVLEDEISFRHWLERVESLSHFEAKLRRPNPSWRPRTETIRKLIESTNADEVDLTAKVDDPEEKTLHAEDSIIEESVEHQGAGYGEISAKGYSEGREQYFKEDRVTRRENITIDEGDSSANIFERLINLLQELVL